MTNTLSAFALVVLATPFFALHTTAIVSYQQEGQGGVVELIAQPNAPVEVANLQLKRRSLDFIRTFNADYEWVSSLTVDVKNASEKNIVYIKLLLDIPLDDSSRRTYGVPISYARQPNPQRASGRAANVLNSGAVATLSVSAAVSEDLRRVLATNNQPLTSKKARLFVEQVWFDDDTMWSMGNYYRRDPATNKWSVVVDQTSFTQKEQNKEPTFMRAAYSTNKPQPATQNGTCYTSIQALIECECGMFRVVTAPDEQRVSASNYKVQRRELCDPSERSCGHIEYNGVSPGCKATE